MKLYENTSLQSKAWDISADEKTSNIPCRTPIYAQYQYFNCIIYLTLEKVNIYISKYISLYFPPLISQAYW